MNNLNNLINFYIDIKKFKYKIYLIINFIKIKNFFFFNINNEFFFFFLFFFFSFQKKWFNYFFYLSCYYCRKDFYIDKMGGLKIDEEN